MIELTPLARPYAKALFASANDTNNLESIAGELKIMAAASKTEGVINTIENPSLSRQEVVDILVKLFEESVSKTSTKLVEILAENKRLNLLESIYFIYQDLLEKHNNQNSIEVFVANEVVLLVPLVVLFVNPVELVNAVFLLVLVFLEVLFVNPVALVNAVFLDVFVAKDVELVNEVVVLSNSVPPASGSKLYAVAVALEVFVFLEVLFVNAVPLLVLVFLAVFVAKDVELVNAVPLLVLVFLAVFVANVVL